MVNETVSGLGDNCFESEKKYFDAKRVIALIEISLRRGDNYSGSKKHFDA